MTGEGRMMHRWSLYLLLVMPMWTSNFPKTSSDLELNMWHFKQRGFFWHKQPGGWSGDCELAQTDRALLFQPWSWSGRCKSQWWNGALVSRAAFTDHNPKAHQGCLSFSHGSVLQMWQWLWGIHVSFWKADSAVWLDYNRITVWMLNLFQCQTLKGIY